MGDFDTPHTPMDRSIKHKISKETQALNDTVNQLDVIDIYRAFHPQKMNFTFSQWDRNLAFIIKINKNK